MDREPRHGKLDEKWIMLAFCCLLVCGTTGMTNIAGLFYGPVCSDLGILRGTFGLQNIIGTAVGTAASLFVPSLLKKYKLKSLMLISVAVGSLSYFLNGFCNSVLGFYLTYALKSLVGSFYSSLVTFMIINSWFEKGSGTASSVMMCFSGVGGALLSPVFSRIISGMGWRTGYRIMGLAMFLFCCPLVFYPRSLIAPAEHPQGEKTAPNEAAAEHTKLEPVTYALTVFCVILFMLMASFSSHVSGFCDSLGFDPETGALVLSMAMVGNIVFKLLDGWLSDRIGARLTNSLLMLAPAAGFAVFLICQSRAAGMDASRLGTLKHAMLLGGFLEGSTNAAAGLACNLIISDLYGKRRYGEVKAKSTVFTTPAYSLGVAAVGYVYDFTASYRSVIILYGAAALLSVAVLNVLYARKNRGLMYR